jgi:hypothetical protein
VTVTWDASAAHFTRSPGFGLKRTEVLVPISKKFALLGSFDECLPALEILPPEKVAMINGWTLYGTDRFIYSSKQDFIFLKRDRTVGGLEDISVFLKS